MKRALSRLLPLLFLALCGCAPAGPGYAAPGDCWHGVIGEARRMRVESRMIYGQWETLKDLHYLGSSPGRCDAGRTIIAGAVPEPRRVSALTAMPGGSL